MPPRRKSKPGPARQSRSRASNAAEPPVDHEQPTEFPLAQELTDLIVDHVYDDLNTLKSCSRVNRSFHMSSRRHQFSRIELTGIEPPSPPTRQWRRLTKNLCEKFHALIVESPEIALLVKDIRIVEGRQYSSVPWLSNEPLLPVVLCSLVNLQGISLAGNSRDSDVVWPKLPARLRETFLAIFQSPKLKRVAISHVDSLPHPYDLFSKFKASNLRGISLSSVTNFQSLLRSQILSTSPTPSFPLPIDSLEFSLEHPGLLALTRALEQISVNLRLLSVDCQNDYDISDVQPAFDLIRRLCGGLQDLKIKVNGRRYHTTSTTCWSSLDLSEHFSLSSIHFHVGFVLPLGITDILRTIPATSPLSQVILEAHLYSKRETAAKSLKATEWLSIDRFLSNDNRPLQLVLKIHVVDDSGIADLSFLESLFEESMPNTHSRGLLRMEIVKRYHRYAAACH